MRTFLPRLLCCILLANAGLTQDQKPIPDSRGNRQVYLDGKLVGFRIIVPPGSRRVFNLGSWEFPGPISDPAPKEKRFNLYLVSPGQTHKSNAWQEFDHNEIINALPKLGTPVEWDVYWAIVLDPKLRKELKNERDLLLAAQSSFLPGDLFALEDVPGSGFLRGVLKVDSLRGLRGFRRRGGLLPRVVILPAGFAVTASGPTPGPD